MVVLAVEPGVYLADVAGAVVSDIPVAILAKFDGKTESDDHYYSAKDGVIAVNFPTEADKLTADVGGWAHPASEG